MDDSEIHKRVFRSVFRQAGLSDLSAYKSGVRWKLAEENRSANASTLRYRSNVCRNQTLIDDISMTRPEKRIPEYSHHLQKLSVSLPQDFVRLDGDKFTKKLQASIKSDVKKGVLKDPFEYELDLMREWYDRCRMSVCAGRFEPGPMRLSSYRDLLAAALQVRLSDLPADKGKKRPARREPAQGAGRAAAQGGGRTAPGAGRAAGRISEDRRSS